MHARVSKYAGPADRLDEGIRNFEGTATALRRLDGFERGYLLVDREAGRAISVTLWASGQAAEASAEQAKQIRKEAAGGAGLSIESVDTYEVAVQIDAGG